LNRYGQYWPAKMVAVEPKLQRPRGKSDSSHLRREQELLRLRRHAGQRPKRQTNSLGLSSSSILANSVRTTAAMASSFLSPELSLTVQGSIEVSCFKALIASGRTRLPTYWDGGSRVRGARNGRFVGAIGFLGPALPRFFVWQRWETRCSVSHSRSLNAEIQRRFSAFGSPRRDALHGEPGDSAAVPSLLSGVLLEQIRVLPF
jgi:hypothetical protein